MGWGGGGGGGGPRVYTVGEAQRMHLCEKEGEESRVLSATLRDPHRSGYRRGGPPVCTLGEAQRMYLCEKETWVLSATSCLAQYTDTKRH